MPHAIHNFCLLRMGREVSFLLLPVRCKWMAVSPAIFVKAEQYSDS
jgi:hypothetical protein